MAKYICLEKDKFLFKQYKITPIRKKDIQKIKQWRNDQINVLRQDKKLTSKMQLDYYKKTIKKSFLSRTPNLILFSFLKNDQCIGYGGFTNIEWKNKKVELSFILETKRTRVDSIYKNDFSIFLNLIIDLCFNILNFDLIHTETYDIRPIHVKILEKHGFILIKKLNAYKKIKETKTDVLFHHLSKDLI